MKSVAVIILGLFAVSPVVAHHSFTAEFDETKPIKLVGTITEMRWSNPHGWIYIDVKGPDGKVVKWACETGSVNGLYRRGWRKEDLPVGTVLTVEGWAARNGSPTMNSQSLLLPDGRRLFAGTSNNRSEDSK
jgi:hypothetical protein